MGDALIRTGAFTVRLPQPEAGDACIDLLLELFNLPEATRWHVARRSVRPDSTFEWFGYGFDRVNGVIAHETFDLGSRGAAPVAEVRPSAEPFEQVTPLPDGVDIRWLTTAERLRSALSAVGRDLIGLIAQVLGRDGGAAVARFSPDDSTLRILNYPAAPSESTPSLRAAEHEDSGALTFIWSDRDGLEVLTRSHEWIPAPSRSWTVVCGRVLSMMTDGEIAPTVHRVSGAPGQRRSLALFFEPRHSASVLPWPPVGAIERMAAPDDQYVRWLSRRHTF